MIIDKPRPAERRDGIGTAQGFPWRRPRRERLLLLLVAAAVLTPVYPISSQDVSRLCLSRAVTDGRLTIGRCLGRAVDRARYDGRTYSDKAPGLALLALPSVLVEGIPVATRWSLYGDLQIWIVRLLTGGVAFMTLVFFLGRVAEGLSPGFGGLVATTFAVGTLAGGLAATTFDQIPTTMFAFAAFLLAWRRQPAAAGVLAGLALLFEYQACLAVVVIGAYVACTGARGLSRYVIGLVPGAVLLGAYDWLAFGSPLHASYRYVANHFANAQASGFFGISLPRWNSVGQVLVGDRGLLVASPIVIAAAAGLTALGRRHSREAIVCGLVTVSYLFLEFGYFLPDGGVSPGPRFLIPALPFLLLGLPFAFAHFGVLARALALWSLLVSTTIRLVWAQLGARRYQHPLVHDFLSAARGWTSHLNRVLPKSVFTSLGLRPVSSAIAISAFAFVAWVIAVRRPDV